MSEFAISYMFRIFWAFFLGLGVASSFRSAWKAETEEMSSFSNRRNDTAVWLDPIVFPVIIVFYLGLCLSVYVIRGSIAYLANVAVDVFLFVSLYFTLLLLLLPVLRKYYTARTCATFWLVPLFLYYQPHMLYSVGTLPPRAVVYIPRILLNLVLIVWMAGFGVIFTIQAASHLSFVRQLKSHSRPVEDTELLAKWQSMKEKIELYGPVDLRYCSVIQTPLTVGLRKKNKITYLPEHRFSEEEAELIFSHELHHIQRNDTHTKFFLRFCSAFGWLHPFVWLAVRRAEDDLELSCDEIVLKDADSAKRRKYAELLLSIAGDSRGYSTCLSASAKALCYRLKATAPGRSKRLGAGLLFLVMFLSCLSVGNLALATERETLAEAADLDEVKIAEAHFYFDADCDDADYNDADRDAVQLADAEALSQYLSEQQVEKLLTINDDGYDVSGPRISGRISGTEKVFSISGDYLRIADTESGEIGQYHMCISPDWEYIGSLL